MRPTTFFRDLLIIAAIAVAIIVVADFLWFGGKYLNTLSDNWDISSSRRQ